MDNKPKEPEPKMNPNQMSGPKKLGWARPGSNASNTPSAISNEDRFGARKEMKTENSDSVPKSEKPGSDEDMPKITFMSKAQRAKRDRPKSPEKVKTEKKASGADVAHYYQDYVDIQGLRPYFRDYADVTSVRRLNQHLWQVANFQDHY